MPRLLHHISVRYPHLFNNFLIYAIFQSQNP